MRCRNCGWENNLGAIQCEKCKAPLSNSMADFISAPSVDQENLKKTIRQGAASANNEPQVLQCPVCGYHYNSEMGACPNCGKVKTPNTPPTSNMSGDFNDKQVLRCPACHEPVPANAKFCSHCGKPFKEGTINPWARPQSQASCSLTPIQWENEDVQPQSIKYTGDSIVLNRENTDPDNHSITSHEQAILTNEKGVWYIEDKSVQQTTYIHISKKTPLEDGDVILLGNRRFVFKK